MTRIFVHLAGLATRISSIGARHKVPLQAAASLLAICLGFWGWMVKQPPQDLNGIFNNLFRTFQLITLNFPSEIGRELPWQLQVARLAVPLVAAMATFNVLVGSITRPARLALLPRTRGHIVITGADQLNDAALEQLARLGQQIVVAAPTVDQTRREHLEGLGLTIVEADPSRANALRALNLGGAAALFVLHDDDLANIRIAMRAIDKIGRRADGLGRLNLVVLINDEELAAEMEAALDGLSRKHGLRYQRICADREALRSEMKRLAPVFLKDNTDRASHILVVGLTGNWQQNLLQLIVSAQDFPDAPPTVSVIANTEEIEKLHKWLNARGELSLVASVQTIPVEGNELPAGSEARRWRETFGAPDLVVILRDDAAALMTMLRLRRPDCELRIGEAPVLVRQSREDHILTGLARLDTGQRNLANLAPFGGMIRAETIARVLDGTGDERARALHEAYCRAYGNAENARSPSMAPWEDLSEGMREANRSSSAHVQIMLASIGIKRLSGQPAPELTEAQIDRLARIEHRRWCADRIECGWRFGSTRDDTRKLHPNIIDFSELTSLEADKDRNAVLNNIKNTYT